MILLLYSYFNILDSAIIISSVIVEGASIFRILIKMLDKMLAGCDVHAAIAFVCNVAEKAPFVLYISE